ncbi:hypothetical protein DERP_011259 [Dermatophagoides pteronyssinus]|uniref:Uncharacterized protein n=1 Tax=Dermatophagoides pteronyssinus TaxID=6956 RepID=A0ABQ8JDA8_DERPT|nr:hypothetical protein DERP_011259 [Dermatophagoides pteronyssinus]
MIGVSGSRHIGRRRGSTASTQQQQHRLSIIESDIVENSERRNSQHRDSKDVSDGSAAATTTKSPNQQQQRRQSSRMSISTGGGGESFPATRFRQRRRAVEISDQRTCALLHSRLKGMKLEDIAGRFFLLTCVNMTSFFTAAAAAVYN